MDWVIEGTQGFANLTDDSGKTWTLQKDKLQDIDVSRIGDLFDSNRSKSIYKLVLKGEGVTDTKGDVLEKGVQGALTLIKADLIGSNKWKVEEVKVNDENKVWLLMAQGKKNIYLMPVVRASGLWLKGGGDCKWDANKTLGREYKRGVEGIEGWSGMFDWRNEWKEEQNDKLKGLMGSGFSITRNVDAIAFRAKQEQGRVTVMKIGKDVSEGVRTVDGDGYLYKNAGELKFKRDIGSKSLSCENGEAYFPLDLVILGDINVERDGGREEFIEIFDSIKQIIGVSCL